MESEGSLKTILAGLNRKRAEKMKFFSYYQQEEEIGEQANHAF